MNCFGFYSDVFKPFISLSFNILLLKFCYKNV